MAYLSKADQVRSKRPHKKKRNKKPTHDGKTPLPSGEKVCAICGRKHSLSIHHVFFGRNGLRRLSNKYKCVEWLCWHCHQSSKGIHGGNREYDLILKKKHQLRLESEGMAREIFMDTAMFGRNYA